MAVGDGVAEGICVAVAGGRSVGSTAVDSIGSAVAASTGSTAVAVGGTAVACATAVGVAWELAWQATVPSRVRKIKKMTKQVLIILDTGRLLQLSILIV